MNQPDPCQLTRAHLDQFMDKLAARAPFRKSIVVPRDDGRRGKVFRTQCDGIEMVMPLPPGEYVEQPPEWQGSVPHPKAMYYDPRSFGTAPYEPDLISHIDVVDAAGNRVDVAAVPQRYLIAEFESAPRAASEVLAKGDE
jgi:hypothetical protein